MHARRLAALVSGLLLTLSPARASAQDPSPYPDPERWSEEIRLFLEKDAATPPPVGAIDFVGSSSIRLWHDTLERDMAPLSVVPRGFGGSTMEDVRYHLDALVLRLRPRAVVLYEGDNDIAAGVPAPRVVETFRAVVAAIHDALPEARIYMLSVKPSPARWTLWPHMRLANHLLAEACAADPRLTFVDLATPLLGADGRPREELYVEDRLHLDAAGYGVWTSVLRPLLLEREGGYE